MRDVMTMLICCVCAYAVYVYFYGDDKSSGPGPRVKKEESRNLGTADIGGGQFKLINQFGEKVTEKSFRHSKSLVFFGFTHCPDICPAALSVLTEAYNQLGANADELKVIFVTIDPENDTPEVIQEYLLNFNKDFVGLTGDRAEIEKMVKSYKAYANKADDGQLMHSDLIYFMDEQGRYVTHFNRENTPAEIVKYVKKRR